MDTSNFSDEALKLYDSLMVAVENGRKFQHLNSIEEFQFLVDWLKAAREDTKDKLLSDKFIKDHEGYIYHVGIIKGLTMLLDATTEFDKTAKLAREKLEAFKEGMDREL